MVERKIIRNEESVQRRKKRGQIKSAGGRGIEIGGLIFTWVAPGKNVPESLLLYVPLLTLLVGFILSNVGIYYTNRWGRSPRPDEILDSSLKGLGREYKLYHFALPSPHVLLAPNGPIVFVAKIEGGEYSVDGDKWKQGFSLVRILGFMGREGLGNPAREAQYQSDQLRRFLTKQDSELGEIPIQVAVVFLSDKVTLKVGETSVPVLRAAKLKGFIRSLADRPLSKTKYAQLEEIFDKAAGLSQ